MRIAGGWRRNPHGKHGWMGAWFSRTLNIRIYRRKYREWHEVPSHLWIVIIDGKRISTASLRTLLVDEVTKRLEGRT